MPYSFLHLYICYIFKSARREDAQQQQQQRGGMRDTILLAEDLQRRAVVFSHLQK